MKKLLILLFIISYPFFIFGQDLLGGYINVEYETGSTFKVNVNVYSTVENGVDRPSIEVNPYYCCITTDTFPRISKDTLSENLILSTYSKSIIYLTPNTYHIIYIDSFLVSNVLNWDSTHNQYLYLELLFFPRNISVYGGSDSPKFLTPIDSFQIDNDGIFKFDPNFIDPEGDKTYFNKSLPSVYQYPSAIKSFQVDSLTGKILWDRPVNVGNHLILLNFQNTYISNQASFTQGFFWMIVNIDSSMIVTNTKQTMLENKKTSLKIYPNPTTTELTIKLPKPPKIPNTITLYDLLGKKIYQTKIIEQTHQINMESYPSGVYIVQVTDGERVWSEKVVKK